MIIAILAMAAGSLTAGGSEPATDAGFGQLIGNWFCAGHFVSSGKTIKARVSFERDSRNGAIIVRHDDLPPGQYHALAIWSANKGANYRAAIVDAYSGMRWLSATGWTNNVLTWVRTTDGRPEEQFAYTLEPAGDLQIDWSVVRQSGAMSLGDTLTCHRRGSR